MQKTKVKLHVDGAAVGGRYRAKKVTTTIEVEFSDDGDDADIKLEVTPSGVPKVVVRDMLRLAGIAADQSADYAQQQMAPQPPTDQLD